MVESLGCWKVHAHWVPRSVMEEHKLRCKNISSQLLEWCAVEDVEFIQCNMTGDKSWFDHFLPEIKQQRMEWHHTSSKKRKPETVTLACTIMETVIWDSE